MTGNRNINLGSGNDNEYIEGDNIRQQGNFGVGVNKGTINTKKLAGTINEAQRKTISPSITSPRSEASTPIAISCFNSSNLSL